MRSYARLARRWPSGHTGGVGHRKSGSARTTSATSGGLVCCSPASAGKPPNQTLQKAAAILVSWNSRSHSAAAAAELGRDHSFERKPHLTLRRINMPTEEHEVPHRGFEIRSAIPV